MSVKAFQRSTSEAHQRVLGYFDEYTGLLEAQFGIALPRPTQSFSLYELKKFCTGLIEGDPTHPWRTVVSSLSVRSRASIAHSLFLFRKVVPQEKPHLDAYVEKMSSSQEDPDPDFLSFARKLTRRIFWSGWDRSYQDHALRSVLSTSSCCEAGRKAGGGRGLIAQERMNRADFLQYVLFSHKIAHRGVSRVQAVDSGGKWRIISIPPRIDGALSALHKTMYSHLSRFEWLLRGDAKPKKFKGFHSVPGEVFVSGDYESATDNLNSALQLAILDELLENSSLVPEGIRQHARSLYTWNLMSGHSDGYVRRQRRGQLMGELTSFPLLCLVNYITFRYCVRRTSVPVRINGDDIVFRATPEEAALWEDGVAKGGLTLSKGKTLKHSRVFTLNSSLFEGVKSGVKTIGFLRPRALWKHQTTSEAILSMNSRFYSFSTGMGRQRTRLARAFFVKHSAKALYASRRSLTRGLGLSVDRETLKSQGLWDRELYYLEQAEERPLPHVAVGGVPGGFVRVSSNWLPPEVVKEQDDLFQEALMLRAWYEDYDPKETSEDATFRMIREGCPPYGLCGLNTKKVRKMLGLSRSKMWKWIYLRRNESLFGRVPFGKGKAVWVSEDVYHELKIDIEFVKSVGA